MAERALQILEIGNNSFSINESNFNHVLEKVGDRPFAVFSINGGTRTGKSYVLNYFLRFLQSKQIGSARWDDWFNSKLIDTFIWRAGTERCTVGVNLWPEPFIIKDQGRELAVLLMDCQGLFDIKTTAQQNAIIFSFSTLCSSVSIFNIMRIVDENVLEKIEFFTGYANMLSNHDGDSIGFQNKNGPDNQSSQKLVFLIRDFDSSEYFGFHDQSSTRKDGNYFKDIFETRDRQDVPQENVRIRNKILESYQDVATFVLPNPGKLFCLNATTEPDADFNKYLKVFVEIMLNSGAYLVPKKISGMEVTGRSFQKYVTNWARLCQKSKSVFPDVKSMAECTAEIQNSAAVDTAMSFYNKAFALYLKEGHTETELNSYHETTQAKALKHFDTPQRLPHKAIQEDYRQKLREEIQKRYEANISANRVNLKMKIQNEMFEAEKRRRDEEKKNLENELAEVARKSKADKEGLLKEMKQAEKIRADEKMKLEKEMSALNKTNEQNMVALEQRLKRAEVERQKQAEEMNKKLEKVNTAAEKEKENLIKELKRKEAEAEQNRKVLEEQRRKEQLERDKQAAETLKKLEESRRAAQKEREELARKEADAANKILEENKKRERRLAAKVKIAENYKNSEIMKYTREAIREKLSAGFEIDTYARNTEHGLSHISWNLRGSNGIRWASLGTAFISEAIVGAISNRFDLKNRYFDAETGDYMGDSRDGAAQQLNRVGCLHYNNGDYEEARDYYSNALKSTSNDADEVTFRTNLSLAEGQLT